MQCGLSLIVRCAILGLLAGSIVGGPALAITSGGKSEEAASPADNGYARGKAAFDREDTGQR
jgi:hypothetical protein